MEKELMHNTSTTTPTSGINGRIKNLLIPIRDEK
jgi:hypothetical protein